MTGSLDFVCDFIEEPKKAARIAVERRPLSLGVLSLVLSGVSLFLAQAVTHRFMPISRGPASLALVCAWSLVWGIVLTAVLHLIADVWGAAKKAPHLGSNGSAVGGPGSAAGLFVLIGLSELAWALMLPAALLLRAVGMDHLLVLLMAASVVGWLNMRLKARSVRDIYGLSLARAWTLVLLPYLGVTVLGLLVFAAAVVGFVASLVKLFS